ncbi:hypothetical protein BD408DRAFT_424551 [Parasitella parasitica]|nr:hypothetical protein BD408DRAFT_424551 [Parasitella parasitica]
MFPGAKSFTNLRNIDGELYHTFQTATRVLGFLADATEWSAAMTEASLSQIPTSLRKLFCILIALSGVSPCASTKSKVPDEKVILRLLGHRVEL